MVYFSKWFYAIWKIQFYTRSGESEFGSRTQVGLFTVTFNFLTIIFDPHWKLLSNVKFKFLIIKIFVTNRNNIVLFKCVLVDVNNYIMHS